MLGNEDMYITALAKKLEMSPSFHVVTTVSFKLTKESVIEESTEQGADSHGPSLHHPPKWVDPIDLFTSTNYPEDAYMKVDPVDLFTSTNELEAAHMKVDTVDLFTSTNELEAAHMKLTEETVTEDSTEQGAHSPGPSLQRSPEQVDPVDLFISTNELEAAHMKRCQAVGSKLYGNGKTFLLVFPDGTGQVFYPSGNIAILITRTDPIEFTFIIMEDEKIKPRIRAIFKSNGQSTCYHPNGLLWLNLDPSGGYYFHLDGNQRKHWTWHVFGRHLHAPPCQTINMKLNSRIEIRITSQDQIQLKFSTNRNFIIFNMGAKLKLKDPQHAYKEIMSTEEHLLQQKTLQIHRLLSKIKHAARLSNSHLVKKIPSKKLLAVPSLTGSYAQTVKPMRLQSSSNRNKVPLEQPHRKQNSQEAPGRAVTAQNSTCKQNNKDQHEHLQTKQQGKKTNIVERHASTGTPTSTSTKSHSGIITK